MTWDNSAAAGKGLSSCFCPSIDIWQLMLR